MDIQNIDDFHKNRTETEIRRTVIDRGTDPGKNGNVLVYAIVGKKKNISVYDYKRFKEHCSLVPAPQLANMKVVRYPWLGVVHFGVSDLQHEMNREQGLSIEEHISRELVKSIKGFIDLYRKDLEQFFKRYVNTKIHEIVKLLINNSSLAEIRAKFPAQTESVFVGYTNGQLCITDNELRELIEYAKPAPTPEPAIIAPEPAPEQNKSKNTEKKS